jgi:hypothetical protein
MVNPNSLIGYELRCWRARESVVLGIVTALALRDDLAFELTLNPVVETTWPCVGAEAWTVDGEGAKVFVLKNAVRQGVDGEFYCDQEPWNRAVISMTPRSPIPADVFPWPFELRIDRDLTTWVCQLEGRGNLGLRLTGLVPELCAVEEGDVVVLAESNGVRVQLSDGRRARLEFRGAIELGPWCLRASVASEVVSAVPHCVEKYLDELTGTGVPDWVQERTYLSLE